MNSNYGYGNSNNDIVFSQSRASIENEIRARLEKDYSLAETGRAVMKTLARKGVFPMVIGAQMVYRIEKPIIIARRQHMPGAKIHLTIKDITEFPDVDFVWRCQHEDCAGKKWPSKKELLATHGNPRDVIKNGETHCYYAVAELPAMNAIPAKIDEQGFVIVPAVEAKPPCIILASDEE